MSITQEYCGNDGPEVAGCVPADDSQDAEREEGKIGELDPSTGEFLISYIEWVDLNVDLGYSFFGTP